MNTIIEQIKAEIKRRMQRFESHIKEYEDTPFTRIVDVNKIRLDECIQILHNIDTLQEQPVELEEEITDFIANHYDIDDYEVLTRSGYSEHLKTSDVEELARHFAQWGAEHAREQMMKEAVELWLVKDKDGLLALFTQEPTVNSHGWLQGGRRFEVYDLFGNEYEKFYPLQDKMEVYDKMKVKLIIIKED